MKKVFYINDKLKSLLSNIIYEIQNYNSTIMKYTENIQNNIDNSNYIKDNKATILRQSFLIDKTMKLFYDFSDINSNNLILNKTSEDINKIIEGITKDFEDLLLSKRIKIKFNNNETRLLHSEKALCSSLFFSNLFIGQLSYLISSSLQINIF